VRFGIKTLRARRTATDDLLLDSWSDVSHKADSLASYFRDIIGEEAGIHVTRPVRRVDVRISGFNESITPNEIAKAISGFGPGCCAEDIHVGSIRRARGDATCTVWIQVPAVADVPATKAGNVKVGGGSRFGWLCSRAGHFDVLSVSPRV